MTTIILQIPDESLSLYHDTQGHGYPLQGLDSSPLKEDMYIRLKNWKSTQFYFSGCTYMVQRSPANYGIEKEKEREREKHYLSAIAICGLYSLQHFPFISQIEKKNEIMTKVKDEIWIHTHI